MHLNNKKLTSDKIMELCKCGLFLCFNLFLSSSIMAQNLNLQEYVDKFVAQEVFKYSSFSIAIKDLQSNELVAQYDADKVLVPASSQKILTNYMSTFLLEEDFRYKTEISYSGRIEGDGILKGNLYIIGSGDPTLGSYKMANTVRMNEIFKKIHQAIKKEGITCIDGDIITDESIFNSFPVCPSWQWNDLGNYYASGAWGLNAHENTYAVEFRQTAKEGQWPQLKSFYPKAARLKLINQVTTGPKGSGDNAYIFGGPYDYTKRIVGTIPPGNGTFKIKGAIPDPPKFFAYQLQKYLDKKGIKSQNFNCTVESISEKTNPLLTIQSVELAQIAQKANFESNNLYTEALLKTVGYHQRGEGSSSQGITAIRKHLRKHKVSMEGQRMDDASGLSARNRFSARFFVDFLAWVSKVMGLPKAKKYLPQVGVSGTVRGMLKNSTAKGKLWAKSGSMEGIQSCTGYAKGKSGNEYSFSIIVNGYSSKSREIRKYLAQLMTALYRLG